MLEAILKEGKPDFNKRECFDCRHLKAAVNWWCTNEKAKKQNGSGIPSIVNCGFWEGCRTIEDLNWVQRTFFKSNYVFIRR